MLCFSVQGPVVDCIVSARRALPALLSIKGASTCLGSDPDSVLEQCSYRWNRQSCRLGSPLTRKLSGFFHLVGF